MTKVFLSISEAGVVMCKLNSYPKFHVLNQCKIQVIQKNILEPVNSTKVFQIFTYCKIELKSYFLHQVTMFTRNRILTISKDFKKIYIQKIR